MNLVEDLSLFLAAFAAALFGQGGGVFYTPLQLWNGIDFHEAAPISLFLIFIMSVSSTLVFRKAHRVDWGIALAMEAPTVLGAFLGGTLARYIPSGTLTMILSILLLTAGWFMLHPPKRPLRPKMQIPSFRWIWQRQFNGESFQLDLRLMVPVMFLVGILTSMVGIGGGALKVPLMVLLFGIPIPVAIGSSAFMVGLTAAAGLLGHTSVTGFNWVAALLLAIPVFIGGQFGSRLSIHLKTGQLRTWFGLFILAVACFTAIRFGSFL